MKRILSSILAIGIGLSPLTVPLMLEPSWGQTQNSQRQQVEQLLEQAKQQAQQGQPLKSIDTLQKVLAISRQLKDRKSEANALLGLGFGYRRIGKPQKALEYYNQSLQISKAVGDRAGVATTLNNIGEVYKVIGQPQRALEYFNQALPIYREVGDLSGVATTLNHIGAVYLDTGQPQQALDYFNQSLPIRQQVGDRLGEAATLNNIGEVYRTIGQPQKALDYLNRVLPIVQDLGNRLREATTRSNIGAIYHRIGQPQRALEFYNQALPIFQEVGNRLEEARTLNNIGIIHHDIDQLPLALAYYSQALLILREVGNRSWEAATLNNIGGIYHRIGQPQKALEYYNQALPIHKAVGDRSGVAVTLNNIGGVYDDIGQPQKALEYYNQTLPIFTSVGDRSGLAATLGNIGRVYRNTKRPTQAIKNYEEAVKITLETRGGLQRENRQKFLEAKAVTAVALVDLLIEQNQPDKAYEWINRVTNAELADYTRLINAKVANSEAQKAIDDWNQNHQQLQFLRQQLQQNFSQARSRQMRDLEAKVNKQAEDISRTFPEVAELFETKPADIDQLRKNIPSGTVIIHPVFLTEFNKIAIFVITKDRLTVTQKNINPQQFNQLLTQYSKQLQNRSNTNYLETSQKLYDILLRPVAYKIPTASTTQVSIIAPRQLRYLPFETLYDSKTDKYLIEKYPINYLTFISPRSWQNRQQMESVTLLKNILSIQGITFIGIMGGLGFLVSRKFGIVGAGILVVVSGGVALWLAFGSKASVLALGNPKPIEPYILKEAEAEVKEIEKIIQGSKSYIHQDATLDRFKTEAPRFPFLHLATHGCFQLEGCKNLNMKANTILFADKEYDIADAALLGLQNTELLALSACQTAKETDVNGEQISGVAYVFERAGAKAVIASLWVAPDTKTKDIAIEFYQNIKKGMSKSQAMRQAKLSQINSHPFFWSPLILIGDGQ
ncbi:MAG TPA: tetratricopeptide repeat protein [Microcoleus sp.]|nr:tetratricopeptide repeat protein [Microcoleus sp.]